MRDFGLGLLKHFIRTFCFVFVVLVIFFTACGDDDDKPKPEPKWLTGEVIEEIDNFDDVQFRVLTTDDELVILEEARSCTGYDYESGFLAPLVAEGDTITWSTKAGNADEDGVDTRLCPGEIKVTQLAGRAGSE